MSATKMLFSKTTKRKPFPSFFTFFFITPNSCKDKNTFLFSSCSYCA